MKSTHDTSNLCIPCTKVKESSQEVYRWITQQDKVGEESITDWFLFNLSKHCVNIEYKLFTKREEGKSSGADFDIWIVYDKYAFYARVQAKRLRLESNGKKIYSQFAYPNGTKEQLENLIKSSMANNSWPLYILYLLNDKTCSGNTCNGCLDEGVLIVDAIQLKRLVINSFNNELKIDDLLQIAIPISCIFCCTNLEESQTDNEYEWILKRLGVKSFIENKNLGYIETIPNIIESFMKQTLFGYGKDDTLHNMEISYTEKFGKVDAVIVFNLKVEYYK